MVTASLVSTVFLALFALSLCLQLWLSHRQVSHVLSNRHATPPAFANSISLEAHQKAADYTVAKQILGRYELILESALVLLLTLGGGLQALHEAVAFHLSGMPYALTLLGALMLISSLVGLPLAYLRQFGLEAQFGFNRMRPPLFFADLLKQWLLTIVLGGPLLIAILWFMEAGGAGWWWMAWLFWIGFNTLVLFIYPRWIAPLFNRFTPLDNPELKARIEALLARCSFQAGGLFVMDGSRRSSHGNAYFSGFGRNRRIVFFDTLLERLTPSQIEAVLAHELGHFKRRHILKRMASLFTLSLLVLWLLAQGLNTPAVFAGLGLETANPALGLALFSIVLPCVTFPFTPLGSYWSRRHEYEADAYAATQTQPGDLSAALVKLYEDNAATLTPDPLHSAFYDSHPPAALRIARLSIP